MAASTFTPIECGECGGPFYILTATGYGSECGHTVTASDITPNLEEGEALQVRNGVLGYITNERCEWCWGRGVTTVTVQGEDLSPELCDSCTDAWDDGARKAPHALRKSSPEALLQRGDCCRFVRREGQRTLVEHVAPCEYPAGTLTDLLTGEVVA